MFAAVNGVKLYYDVINPQLGIGADDALSEKRALICIPGGPGGDHHTLRPAFDRFASHAQVIYLDPRGSGRSEAGASDTWTLDQWADDVAAFVSAIGVDKPVVLGVSGGAMIAASYLARHPAQAGGAVLVNACARLDKEALIAGWRVLGGEDAANAARNMYDRGVPEDMAPFFQHCFPHYARRPSTMGMTTRVRMNFAVTRHFFSESAEAFSFDFRGRLGSVTCPVLALAGAHDPVTRVEWAREMAAELRQCRYVEFDDASHMIASDAPDRFYAEVERFLGALAS